MDRITTINMQNILENEGISTSLQNDYTIGIGFQNCNGPELWIVNDEDYKRAIILIESMDNNKETKAQWLCKNCGEVNEGTFSVCWNCQTPLD